VIVNQGATRGDAYATATLDAPLGRVLTELVTRLRDATTPASSPAITADVPERLARSYG